MGIFFCLLKKATVVSITKTEKISRRRRENTQMIILVIRI